MEKNKTEISTQLCLDSFAGNQNKNDATNLG